MAQDTSLAEHNAVPRSSRHLKLKFAWRQIKRMLIVSTLGVTLFVAFTTIATVELPQSQRADVAIQIPQDELWPPRAKPQFPNITIETGSGPIDRGPYNNCRVVENFRTDAIEGYMLVSSLSDPRIQVNSGCTMTAGGEKPSVYRVHLKNQTLVAAFVMPTAQKEAVGTMYYLAGSNGLAAQEQKFLNIARDDGWNVIATTVEMTFSHSQQLELGSDGEKKLALRIDNHLADRAYAMESLTAYLEDTRPDLQTGPRVLVGLSAGAIALPAVAARIGPLDAAVLIAGGENVPDIILTSPLFDEHTELIQSITGNASVEDNHEVVTDQDLRRNFANNASKLCALDSRETAMALNSTPVLMLHAKFDKIVPARTGDALYESLARPERWSYRTGHLGLCAMLPWKARHILQWLDDNTAPDLALELSL